MDSAVLDDLRKLFTARPRAVPSEAVPDDSEAAHLVSSAAGRRVGRGWSLRVRTGLWQRFARWIHGASARYGHGAQGVTRARDSLRQYNSLGHPGADLAGNLPADGTWMARRRDDIPILKMDACHASPDQKGRSFVMTWWASQVDLYGLRALMPDVASTRLVANQND